MKLRSSTNSDQTVISEELPSISQKFLEVKFAALEAKISLQIDDAKNDIIKSLREENERLKKDLETTKKDLSRVEKDVIELQQYIRRNHVEVVGVPFTVSDNILEDKVVEMFNKLEGVNLRKSDVEACHRLKQKKGETGPARTIIRFVNRKNAEMLLRKNKELRGMDLSDLGFNAKYMYINCNLCPYNRMLWGKCKGLHTKKLITRFWVYNGKLNIITNNEIRYKIAHLNDLKNLFSDKYPEFFE